MLILHNFIFDIAFWFFITFTVFLLIIGIPVWKIIITYLGNNIKEISNQIDKIKKLKFQEKKHLYETKYNYLSAQKDVNSIIERAKNLATNIKSDSKLELEKTKKRENLQFSQRISKTETNATEEIKKLYVKSALHKSKEILKVTINDEIDKDFINNALKQIKNTSLLKN